MIPKPKNMQWQPQWTQSIEGCPVQPKLYRTISGIRTLAGVFETTPIYQFSFTPIPVNVEWSVTKPGIWPFTATMALQTADYANYDLQNWLLSVVLESSYSKSAKREGEIKFLLEIKDVCWDFPLSAFALKSATQIYDIWIPHQIAHDYLLDVWSDYCTGSSY